MDKQELRNALSELEDTARRVHNKGMKEGALDTFELCRVLAKFIQTVREEIVK